nr:MAG TPA: hypothetical protein [Caudoviricetes sp.]
MYASAVKLRGSKVAVREFFVTLQNDVLPLGGPAPPVGAQSALRYRGQGRSGRRYRAARN